MLLTAMVVTRARFSMLVLLCCITVLFSSGIPLHAQQIYNDDAQLFSVAYQAYQNEHWLDAAMYFQAYIQRKPLRMSTDSKHARQVYDALNWSLTRINDDKATISLYQSGLSACQRKLTQTARQLDTCQNKDAAGPQVSSSVSGLISEPPTPPPPPALDPLTTEQLPPSYPLVCRGGGHILFTYLSASSFSPKPALWIDFEKAQAGVGANKENLGVLAPGQCSWLDRMINLDEPSRIMLTEPILKPNAFGLSWNTSQVAGNTLTPPYLLALQSPDKVQTFYVYNDRQGNFRVTNLDSAASDFITASAPLAPTPTPQPVAQPPSEPTPTPQPVADSGQLKEDLRVSIANSGVHTDYQQQAQQFIDQLLAHLDDFALGDSGITNQTMSKALRRRDVGDRINGTVQGIWGTWMQDAQNGGFDPNSTEPDHVSPFRHLVIRLIQGRQGKLTDKQQRALYSLFSRKEEAHVWRDNMNGVVGAINREIFQ